MGGCCFDVVDDTESLMPPSLASLISALALFFCLLSAYWMIYKNEKYVCWIGIPIPMFEMN